MEIYFIIALVGIIAMSVASFVVGKRSGTSKEDSLNIENLRQQLDEKRRAVEERDEAETSPAPPPQAAPRTAATTGFGVKRI